MTAHYIQRVMEGEDASDIVQEIATTTAEVGDTVIVDTPKGEVEGTVTWISDFQGRIKIDTLGDEAIPFSRILDVQSKDGSDGADTLPTFDVSAYQDAHQLAPELSKYLQKVANQMGMYDDVKVSLDKKRTQNMTVHKAEVSWHAGPTEWAVSVLGGDSMFSVELRGAGHTSPGNPEIVGFDKTPINIQPQTNTSLSLVSSH